MARVHMPYVQFWRGTYRVRRRVPLHLVPLIGKTEILQALDGCKDEAEANRLSFAVNADIETRFKKAQEAYDDGIQCKPEEAWTSVIHVGDPSNPCNYSNFGSNVRLKRMPYEEWVAAGKPEKIGWQPEVSTTPIATFDDIIENWKRFSEKYTHDTLETTQRAFDRLAKFLGHNDSGKVLRKDIIRYHESLIDAKELSVPTIANYLTRIKVVYKSAVEKEKVSSSPMVDYKIPTGKGVKRKPYTLQQVEVILRLTIKEPPHIFIPLLIQSYTGCRINEPSELTTSGIYQTDGVWMVAFDPEHRVDRQPLKTRTSKRDVPLHPQVIKYLLPYIETMPEGPLFPGVPTAIKRDKTGVYNTRTPYLSRKLGEFIREKVGITDKLIAPNHSYRHFLRTYLLNKKVDRRIRNMILGHTSSDAADGYESPDIPAMIEAINLLPSFLALK